MFSSMYTIHTSFEKVIRNTQTCSLQNYRNSVTIERVSTEEWDSCCAHFDDSIPEQASIFNQAHWGDDNIETVIFREKGKIIGGAVILVKSLPILNTGLAVIKWGPVWRRSKTENNQGNLRSVLNALLADYCHDRNLHLTVLPVAHPGSTSTIIHQLKSLGFKSGECLAAPARYIVNVDQSAEELRASLDQKWRYNLKKSDKNNFEISFEDTQDGLRAFMDLYAKMMSRKQFLDSSAIGSLEKIITQGVDSIKPRIVLVRKDGEIIAGGVFSLTGDMAQYMFGATADSALRLRAGYAMHWWLAEKLCNMENIKHYDLGGNDLDSGLHQFKKGFVGKTGILIDCPPRYHFSISTRAHLLGTIIFKLKDMKSTLTRMFHSSVGIIRR